MPHGHSKSDLSDYVAKLDRLERKLEREKERHMVNVYATYDAVNNLPDDTPEQIYKTVLQYRYIHGMSFEDIQAVMHASRATVYNWHMKALDLLKL